MKSYSVEAVVLRMRALGEADRIVTLFSRERGKQSAVARGASPGTKRTFSMPERWLGIVVGSDRVVVVDAEAPKTGPLVIQADHSWSLQRGKRAAAYSVIHRVQSARIG